MAASEWDGGSRRPGHESELYCGGGGLLNMCIGKIQPQWKHVTLAISDDKAVGNESLMAGLEMGST